MAYTLILVRHAKPVAASSGISDYDRELTPEGREAVESSFPETFSVIDTAAEDVRLWSSPAVRAWETAEVVADALGFDWDDIEEHESIYYQDEIQFLEEVAACEADTIIAVGHIPMVENLVEDLSGSVTDFKPGAAAALLVEKSLDEPRPAKLLWFAQGPKTGA